jgi:hypothetical protein
VNPVTRELDLTCTGHIAGRKSPTYWIRYYTPDGKRHKVKGYRDRQATASRAAELHRRGIRLDAGLVDSSEVHEKTPLLVHLADCVRYLSAKENTGKHVALESLAATGTDRAEHASPPEKGSKGKKPLGPTRYFGSFLETG